MVDVPRIGSVLGDRYRVVEALGSGGMGVVFRAQNIVTGKQVAIKWLHPPADPTSGVDGRPHREARAASCLKHPNVVDVYDILPEGPTFILIMELLVGETLGDYLRRSPRLDLPALLALLLPAMDGVAVAHANGVVHRDLKPENIFLERVPGSSAVTTKVLDFGIAKRVDDSDHPLTDTGKPLGTPSYMSLEQLRGDRDIDERADVYALGVMLYEAVTGQMPHDASSLPELAIKRATVLVPPVKELRPELPTTLARIIDWAIARDRDDRVPDVKTLRDELALFAREHGFRGQMTHPDAELPQLAPRREPPRGMNARPRISSGSSASPARTARTATRPRPRSRPIDPSLRVRERAVWLTLVLGLVAFTGSALVRDRTFAGDNPRQAAVATSKPHDDLGVDLHEVAVHRHTLPMPTQETAPPPAGDPSASAPVMPDARSSFAGTAAASHANPPEAKARRAGKRTAAAKSTGRAQPDASASIKEMLAF